MGRKTLGWTGVAAAVAIAAAAGVWHATASAASGPDLLVHLTSGPITAHSGQQVTHTVEIAAVGEAAGESHSQMTFTTTVPLDNATAIATMGDCQVVSPVSITCEINGVVTQDEPVLVTITGQIPAATNAGQVVYNVANLVSASTDPDTSNNTSSNAYVLAATALAEQPGERPDSSVGEAVAVHTVKPAAAATARASGNISGAVFTAIALAAVAQALIMYLLRRKRSRQVAARHRRPAGYRARHATSAWRRFAQTEIRSWGRGRRRHRALRSYRGVVSLPAAGLVLLLFLSMSALPGLAAAPQSKPDRPASSDQARKDKDKDKDKRDKDRDKKSKKPKPDKPAAVPSEETPAAPSTQAPVTQPQAAPAKPDPGPQPEQDPRPDPEPQPAWAPEPDLDLDLGVPELELPELELPEADQPKTDQAKTIAALYRSLRRGEYLRQMVTCTKADLATARARIARLEEDVKAGRAPEQDLEDSQSTAAVLQMAAEATEAEIQRVEAWTAELSQRASEAVRGATRFAKIVDGRISSPFGNRFDPYYQRWQLHAGVDIAAGTGTPVHAASAGVVRRAGWNGGYGNHTCIEHGEVRGERLSTCYSHQSELAVAVGQKVEAGDVIGKVGSTGASTGPHLHFEVRLSGRPVDPTPWIQGA